MLLKFWKKGNIRKERGKVVKEGGCRKGMYKEGRLHLFVTKSFVSSSAHFPLRTSSSWKISKTFSTKETTRKMTTSYQATAIGYFLISSLWYQKHKNWTRNFRPKTIYHHTHQRPRVEATNTREGAIKSNACPNVKDQFRTSGITL